MVQQIRMVCMVVARLAEARRKVMAVVAAAALRQLAALVEVAIQDHSDKEGKDYRAVAAMAVLVAAAGTEAAGHTLMAVAMTTAVAEAVQAM